MLRNIRLVLFLLIAFVLAACAPAANGLTAQFVALPSEGQLLIAALVSASVMYLAVLLGKALKFDFTSLVGPIVAVIVPALVTFIQNYLGMIPDMWQDPFNAFVHFLVVLAASLGIYISAARVKNRNIRGLLG